MNHARREVLGARDRCIKQQCYGLPYLDETFRRRLLVDAALCRIAHSSMLESIDAQYRRQLAKQLVMNEETWRRLQAHGITATTEVRLDFRYVAPDRASAESLNGVLGDQTDYDVRVEAIAELWIVVGSTRPTAISLSILDQWVDWMVTAGVHHNCEFDGWGTTV